MYMYFIDANWSRRPLSCPRLRRHRRTGSRVISPSEIRRISTILATATGRGAPLRPSSLNWRAPGKPSLSPQVKFFINASCLSGWVIDNGNVFHPPLACVPLLLLRWWRRWKETKGQMFQSTRLSFFLSSLYSSSESPFHPFLRLYVFPIFVSTPSNTAAIMHSLKSVTKPLLRAEEWKKSFLFSPFELIFVRVV